MPRAGGVGAGQVQGLGEHRGQQLHVGPSGQLGDHPAVAGVQIDLAAHHRGDDHRPTVDHGGRGLVAGGLDPEDPVRGRSGHVGRLTGQVRETTGLTSTREHPSVSGAPS